MWEYAGVNEVILADLTMNGWPVKALIHADSEVHGLTTIRSSKSRHGNCSRSGC
jgi:glucose dehydrogenase